MGNCRMFCLFFFILTLLPFISAGIYFNDDSPGNFNVGDEVSISFRVEESLPKMDYVEVSVVCGETSRVIFKEFKNFLNQKSYDFNVSSLADVSGDCFIEVRFDDEVERTSNFVVSSELKTNVFLNSRVFMPGERVLLNGSVNKFSDANFNYSVEVVVGDFISRSWGFDGSDFLLNFTLPVDIPSGSYDMKILFEEKNLFGKVLNSGEIFENLTVLSKPASILIDCEEQFKPPYNLSVGVQLLDQSGVLIEGESVVVRIFDLENNIYYDGVIPSGSFESVYFPSNSSMGGWRISAFYAGLTAVKPIYISENRQVVTDFVNGTSYLSISNVGNIPYEGVLQVSFTNESGEYNLPINVELPLGDSYNYDLGYSGNYNLSVEGKEFSNVYITGAVISSGKMVSYVFVGLIFVGIVLLIFLFFYFRYKSRRSKKDFGGEVSPKILVSQDKNVKFIYPKKDDSNSETVKQNKIFVSDENPVRKLFQEDYQKKHAVDISSYSPSVDSLDSSNKDIPVVRNALKGVNSNSGYSGGSSVSRPSQPVKKMVYGLFYRKGDSSELSGILKKYGLSVYRVGDMRFSLLKSSKNPEKMLVNLAKLIMRDTENHDVVLHAIEFSKSHKLSKLFPSIRDVLKEGEGLLISSAIFNKISDKKSFVFFRNLPLKESVIKLYRLIL